MRVVQTFVSVCPQGLIAGLLNLPCTAQAAEDTVGQGLSRMVFGMVIVLLCIGLLAWLARKVLPGQGSLQAGVIKQVGGLNLSPRERVVVLEVGGRWLVVGTNAGQMTALGEMPKPETEPMTTHQSNAIELNDDRDKSASFATRLQQAMQHTLQNKVKSFKNKP